ncbi:TetR/AcrR family transcriptional regulator [Seohaeicola zhoushanensis]|uniref:TetR family transcriptional regulator n=1 Tax=Seohaeicola zhoushanensis TaxID=1569283 RepID=A0A8J3GWN9_9RHOB|nr:TetR/AcrR family transcriptional regulator [Seohaeicola zhoushanensis]GHF45004.1 TetR family transcriptional regulator [Seohaeicola zhoushanensis]
MEPDVPKDRNSRAERIIETAAELFVERGYESTSMRDIANACGISKSLLYHHFSDKYEIFTKAASTGGSGLNEQVEEALAKGGSAREKLLTFMQITARYFEENRLSWIASSQEFWSSNENRVSLKMRVRRDAFENMLRGILDEGVASGEFRIEDTRMAGRLILSSLNWMQRWYRPGGTKTAQDIAEAYFSLILNGIDGA